MHSGPPVLLDDDAADDAADDDAADDDADDADTDAVDTDAVDEPPAPSKSKPPSRLVHADAPVAETIRSNPVRTIFVIKPPPSPQ